MLSSPLPFHHDFCGVVSPAKATKAMVARFGRRFSNSTRLSPAPPSPRHPTLLSTASPHPPQEIWLRASSVLGKYAVFLHQPGRSTASHYLTGSSGTLSLSTWKQHISLHQHRSRALSICQEADSCRSAALSKILHMTSFETSCSGSTFDVRHNPQVHVLDLLRSSKLDTNGDYSELILA
ncbi:hypothetical protein BS78_10G138100 [Paspalum vaginatum]|nr:hypothetical protein BS78_10G138100 [Paspalum vaginatum]